MHTPKHTYVLRGALLESGAKTPLQDLRVEAWDEDLLVDDLLGSAVSDENGRFEIVFDSSHFRELFFDRTPELYFKVFEGRQILRDTKSQLTVRLETREVDVVIEVRRAPAPAPAPPIADLEREDVLLLQTKRLATPAQLMESDPELHRKLLGIGIRSLRSQLDAEFANASSELAAHLAKLDLGALVNASQNVRELVRQSLERDDVPEAVRREGFSRLGRARLPDSLGDVLRADVPVRDNPLFASELARADLHRVADRADLEDDVVSRIRALGLDVTRFDDATLTSLVQQKVVNEAQARRLGVESGLYRWADGDVAFLGALEKELGGEPLALDRLARFRPSDYLRLLPEQPERASLLARSIELLFPDATLRALHRPVDVQALDTNLTRLAPLLEKARFGELDLVEPEFLETRALVWRHAGLGLADVIDDAQLSPKQKATTIARRVAWMAQLRDKNPSASIVALDTFDEEAVGALDFGDVDSSERKLVLDEVRAEQRMLRVTRGLSEDAIKLRTAGFQSAMDVVRGTAKTIADRSGVDPARAGAYIELANDSVKRTLGLGVLLVDRVSPFHPPMLDFGPSEVDTLLRRLPGFADYFGNQSQCRCSHCQSLLGPAAYFVDLMEFVEEHIGSGRSSPASDPYVALGLFQRRPDLWFGIPLTCSATDTLVAYLTLVVEILENHAWLRSHAAALPTDRAVIEEFVARLTYDRGTLAAPEIHGFAQPFCLPLDRLNTYLSHFPIARSEIASVVLQSSDANTLAAARLGLSEREVALVTTPDRRSAFLIGLYAFGITRGGVPAISVPAAGELVPFDLERLLVPMRVTRTELTELLTTRFVDPLHRIRIEARRRDLEEVAGLDAAALDRLHRFTRLWRATPWTPVELDLVLEHLGATDTMSISDVAALVELQKRLRVGVEELCALFERIPTRSLRAGEASAFDRAFNAPTFVRTPADVWLPATSVGTFVHPAFRAGAPSDPTLHRLLAGLGVDDEELLALLGTSARTGFVLDHAGLSRLYQHARLAERLRIPIGDWLRLLALFGESAEDRSSSVAMLERRVRTFDDWRATKLSLDELAFVTGAATPASAELDEPAEIVSRVMASLGERRSLVFADTVFAFFEGITEDQSRRIVAMNGAIVDRSADDGRNRLTPSFDFSGALALPADVSVSSASLHALLAGFHAKNVLPPLLASELDTTPAILVALLRLAGYDLSDAALAASWQRMVRGEAPLDALVTAVGDVQRLRVLFRARAFTPTAIDFVRAHATGASPIFAIDDFRALAHDDVGRIVDYGNLLALGEETALHEALVAFSGDRFGSVGVAACARLFESEAGLLATLDESISLPASALKAVGQMRRALQLTQELGVSGDVLSLAASSRFEDLNASATAVFAAFRARYPDQSVWLEKIGPFEDRLLERRRDALSDFVLRTLAPDRFRDENDLYHWFLIDTELDGCARTSRVVAGIATLQLYVQRCLLRLEQSEDGVRRVEVDAEGASQWEWRKSYRLWEANRKVFLFPEAYLDQEFRDDKTEPFRVAESRLLQGPVDEHSTLATYSDYLDAFSELAGLAIAGAYHDRSSARDVLHLFGVTREDPPVFFYRTIDHIYRAETGRRPIAYHPWCKVNVQIPVRKVSPVVFRSRLFVFWIEIATRADQVDAEFVGYEHGFKVKYTALQLDGSWSPPQTVDLGAVATIQDELADESERLAVLTLIRGLPSPDGDTDGARLAQYHAALDGVVAQLRKAVKRDATILDRSSISLTVQYDRSTAFVSMDPRSTRIRALLAPRLAPDEIHVEARSDYTLAGHPWDRVYPDLGSARLAVGIGDLSIAGLLALHSNQLDTMSGITPLLFLSQTETRLFLQKRPAHFHAEGQVHAGWTRSVSQYHAYAQAVDLSRRGSTLDWRYPILEDGPEETDVIVVNGSLTDAIVDAAGDLLYLHVLPGASGEYILKRLGTTLAERMERALFEGGVDGLLDVRKQETELGESRVPFSFRLDSTLLNDAKRAVDRKVPDFEGPFGVYVREVFLHMPLLLAERLNAEGRFAEAQRWLQRVFDPTSNAIPSLDGITDPAERTRRTKDRVWQYVEFRNHRIETLREQLADIEALDVSENDPFNPHAIARQRLGAYMRGVFMKYIDNLIDWGDSLFAQDTLESINEATLLYVMAQDLLGPRPRELGDCTDERDGERTYDALVRRMRNCPDSPLDELESVSTSTTMRYEAIRSEPSGDGNLVIVEPVRLEGAMVLAGAAIDHTLIEENAFRGPDFLGPHFIGPGAFAQFGSSLLRQICVFCIPANKELLALWDRVEDRLAKIRNCMNLSGIRRQLALFAPEIDPRLLIRARALGLSLEDLLETTSGNLPPYRFAFLIARAKEYAATTQALGAGLLTALEKRDSEELARLRQAQQQNVLALSTQLRDQEVQAAEASLAGLQQRKVAIESRLAFYKGLFQTGLSSYELDQLAKLQDSITIDTLAAPLYIAASVVGAIPSVAGTCTSTGSREAALVLKFFAECVQSYSALQQRHATVASIRGSHHRRAEGWEFTIAQTENELEEIDKLLVGQELRVEMARRSRELHQTSIEQMEEISEFYRTKFSNLELFGWLSRELQNLHRNAYLAANEMAKMAETAYRFERGDDATPLLRGGYWDATKTGLLAGERLLADLRDLERRYVETNYRSLEIDQAFSMAQLDPKALHDLRVDGSCEFVLPETQFDLFYPGQYRRRVKSARLTLPCITGPYTNVSANLTLVQSSIRKVPELGPEHLEPVPPTRTVSIATSTGQNDAGVFRLDFQDERYAPFEGAGAVGSRWRLSLPRTFRPFDYRTLNDVILHLSYTAEYDESLREAVEARQAEVQGTLLNALTEGALPRSLSLRQEYSSAFHRLLHVPSTADEPVSIEVSGRHFPLFLQNQRIALTSAHLVLEIDREALRRDDGTLPSSFTWPEVFASVGGPFGPTPLTFSESPTFAGMPTAELSVRAAELALHTGTLDITLRVANGGDLAPREPALGDPSLIDEEKLTDIVLYIEYQLASAS